ncbi:MAG: bifunctional folylpolyglutamate synthase/dihydrofolate synthase, partial [Fibrobacter sp.]|nr:bifunctional folylpolyglutamate synthase/dihydrofolate synthase [Fibrobacter sp.]
MTATAQMTPRQWLQSRMLFGIKTGLGNISQLCARLGNPQDSFASVHLVGTNGKGSTSYWLTGILQAHGLKCGLFTSPHLVSVRERVRLGTEEAISEADFVQILAEVQQKSSQ